jgi:endoglucanase
MNIIRQTNPFRRIIADGPEYASTHAIDTLTLPLGDPNLLAAVHTYEPFLFTLQGTDDVNGPGWSTTGVIYPGPPAMPIQPEPDTLAIQWMADWFDDYNTLPTTLNPSGPMAIQAMFSDVAAYLGTSAYGVYNGEWGVTRDADDQSRANWIRDNREASENLGVGWAIWDDGGDFAILDADTGEWDPGVLDALFN